MDDPSVSLGENQYGSSAALPIFANAIKNIYELGEYQAKDETIYLNDRADWYKPENVKEIEICDETYEKATRFCKQKKEIYLSSNYPKKECNKHLNPFSRFNDK